MVQNDRRDICTVISLLPIEIKERKPGLYPGEYIIPAAKERGDIGLLVIQEGIHYVPQLEHPAYRAVTPAREVAKSLVDDFRDGCLGLEEDAEPGLFWVFGEYEKAAAKVSLRADIHNASVRQSKWFVNLVRIADTEWAQHPGNHNVISELMKHAAVHLGLDKEWLVNPDQMALVNCPVCRTLVSAKAIVCGQCRAILNAEEYKKFEFAQTK